MELAGKCIHDHKNPLVKFNLPGSKLLVKSDKQEDVAYTEEHLNNLKKVLNHLRVERRCARTQANWLPDKNLSKVCKVVKNLTSSFGFQDKNGIFLYPEETLFLLETNRLELKFEGTCLTIQDAYKYLLAPLEFNKYLVYKKLVLQGYRVLNDVEYQRRLLKKPICKRKNDESSMDDDTKRFRAEETDASMEEGSKKQILINHISNIFQELQSNAPKVFVEQDKVGIADYYVFLSKNNTLDYDFRVLIRNNSNFHERCNANEKDIYVVCSEGNLSFYKALKVVIPDLS